MTIMVHVDDIFTVGEKARCDQFGKELDQMVPVKNLGELRWYSGCFYERDWDKGFYFCFSTLILIFDFSDLSFVFRHLF